MKRLSLTLVLTATLTCLSGLTNAEEPQSSEESGTRDQAVERPDDSKATTAAPGLDRRIRVDEGDRSSEPGEDPRPDGNQGGDGAERRAAEPTAEEATVTSTPENKLTAHGYLTLAYANGSGRRLFGVTDRGTVDYGTAAVQFRYARGDKQQLRRAVEPRTLGGKSD